MALYSTIPAPEAAVDDRASKGLRVSLIQGTWAPLARLLTVLTTTTDA